MGCRNHQRGEAVARMIKQKTKNQDVFSYQLDLASLESVKSFVDDFNNKESALHVLINNAGKNIKTRIVVDSKYFNSVRIVDTLERYCLFVNALYAYAMSFI